MTRTLSCCGLILGLAQVAAYAQQPATGEWSGYMISPAGSMAETTVEISTEDGVLSGVLDWDFGRFQLYDLEVSSSMIAFSWQAAGDLFIRCRVRPGSGIAYIGGCKDHGGRIGGMMMAPPGFEADPDEMYRGVAFEVWGVNMDTYLSQMRMRTGNVEAEEDYELGVSRPAGSMVDVDDVSYEVFMNEAAGPVTVVFEAGLGEDFGAWSAVIRLLGDSTSVFAYDRAGQVHSDTDVNGPTSLDEQVGVLAAVLEASGARPPFLLVGHAYGAMIVRRFAAMNADQVAGLVLVHPTDPNEGAILADVDASGWERYWEGQKTLYQAMPEPVRREFDLYASLLEGSAPADSDISSGHPTLVLSGARVVESPRWVGETEAGRNAIVKLHEAYASESVPASFRPIATSGAHIPREAPTEVERAVRDLISFIRQSAE